MPPSSGGSCRHRPVWSCRRRRVVVPPSSVWSCRRRPEWYCRRSGVVVPPSAEGVVHLCYAACSATTTGCEG